jgi:lipoate-protein ligase B
VTAPLLHTVFLGLQPYTESLALQRRIARARSEGALSQDVLLLVEHPNVITIGRRGGAAHLLASPERLASAGIEIYDVERGGDVTFHGPGQLVAYPIMDLKRHRRDLHWYLRQLEATLIATLGHFGIAAGRRDGLTGVWTDERKIASIGVHARDWVTWHGMALNVSTRLVDFQWIVPCGITGVEMTSMERELGTAPDAVAVREQLAATLANTFGLAATPASADALDPSRAIA